MFVRRGRQGSVRPDMKPASEGTLPTVTLYRSWKVVYWWTRSGKGRKPA
jgi:hypothetical protein